MSGIRNNQKIEEAVKKIGPGYGVLLLIFNLIFAGIFWWQLPAQIPLFYSLTYGESQLANKVWFLILPGLSIIVFGGLMLLLSIKVKSKLYPKMMSWLQVLCLFLLSLAMVHIVMVVL